MLLCRCSRLVFALGLLWPLYASFKCIEAQDAAQAERWLKHWVVIGAYLLVDNVFSFTIPGAASENLVETLKIALLIWIQVRAYNHFSRVGTAACSESLRLPETACGSTLREYSDISHPAWPFAEVQALMRGMRKF